MVERDQEIAAFLQSAGWSDATRTPLAGDASARRYDRVTRQKLREDAVLMDAPVSAGENITPFLNIARYLSNAGFSAPAIIAQDTERGLILMEDLGDDLFARVCRANPDLELQLYQAAIDTLVALHRNAPPELQPYSSAVYEREAQLLTDWYLPAATGEATAAQTRSDFTDLIRNACDSLQGDRQVCVLRDYHAENLLWLPDRIGVARVGQLDFQDALLGHPAYDLVSLLEDARRDTASDLRDRMIQRYLDQSGLDPTVFRQAYATLGAQRNLKIIGIFSRLWRRDGKASYVDLIPRVWQHLQTDLSHPSLDNLRKFIGNHVPEPTSSVLNQIRAARP